ncbi:DUF4397 domain-containing protein [Pontibacter pamirensis]|uniref:DUF4397 domain-containing protein n=1 Tax=Pontibacter pamirensis TaxID=2562824 RepID=UPI00138A1DAB|nr:DUF4397 domain-containing protein [Pontibacter pamirensis]
MKKKPGKLSLSKVTVLLCSLLTISLTSCLDAQDSDNDVVQPATYISIYHGAPDAPEFDIFVDNSRINSQAFKYANYSDYFNFITPGNHRLKFTPVNASNAFIDTALTFSEGKIYSLFAVNRLQNIELLALQDSLIILGTGEAGLRVVQLSPDAPALDIVMIKNNTSNSFTTNLEFKETTAFRKVASGTHTIQVRRAENQDVILSVPNITLESARNYSFIIRGFATPPTGNLNVLSLQVIRNY